MATAGTATSEAMSNFVIMSCIAEHLSNGGWCEARQALTALSLVSKAWREVAARPLYRSLDDWDSVTYKHVREEYLLLAR
jgi:hypothetical protein